MIKNANIDFGKSYILLVSNICVNFITKLPKNVQYRNVTN